MKIIFFNLLLVFSVSLNAQAPEGFRYQAIVRNIAGEPLVSQFVSFRFSIFAGSPVGMTVYEEKHNVITDQFGMVSIIIGNGTDKTGSFESIEWGNGGYFLKMELDITGGSAYSDMGTTQLLSVPYALFAKEAANGFSGNYDDLANKPVIDGSETKIIPGNNLIITGSGTMVNPYIITNGFSGDYNDLTNKPTTDGSETNITVGDNLTMEGAGTISVPYILNTRKHFIGENYGGGIVFYVYDNDLHGLIAAPVDQNPEIEWYNGMRRYTNTAGDGVRAGDMNTTLIIAMQTNDNPVGNFAAKVCADYSVTANGVTYGDWYLPSKYELNLMFLQKQIIGGFADKYYWTSTEFSSISAWCQNFSNGSQFNLNKSLPYGVRAIRAF